MKQHCIEEIKVPEPFVGRSLRDLNLRKNFRVNVLAAGPQSSLMVNPPASHVLETGTPAGGDGTGGRPANGSRKN